jgi:hypothetical protein
VPCCKQAWVQTLGSVCTPSGPKGGERTEDTEQHQTTSSDPLAHHAPAQLPPSPFCHTPGAQGFALSTHFQSSATLRTAGTLQGVPPPCCGRRVAVWRGCALFDRKGFGTRKQPANLALSPCAPSSTTQLSYVPRRPSALDDLVERVALGSSPTFTPPSLVLSGMQYQTIAC